MLYDPSMLSLHAICTHVYCPGVGRLECTDYIINIPTYTYTQNKYIDTFVPKTKVDIQICRN